VRAAKTQFQSGRVFRHLGRQAHLNGTVPLSVDEQFYLLVPGDGHVGVLVHLQSHALGGKHLLAIAVSDGQVHHLLRRV